MANWINLKEPTLKLAVWPRNHLIQPQGLGKAQGWVGRITRTLEHLSPSLLCTLSSTQPGDCAPLPTEHSGGLLQVHGEHPTRLKVGCLLKGRDKGKFPAEAQESHSLLPTTLVACSWLPEGNWKSLL